MKQQRERGTGLVLGKNSVLYVLLCCLLVLFPCVQDSKETLSFSVHELKLSR